MHVTFSLFQSLQDDDLKMLGRDHSSHQALQTIEEARRLCPGRVSVDVMFGRPKQTTECWENELSELLGVCDDHVSLYQLTLERGTQLFRQVERGEVTLPAEDVMAEMYRRGRRILHRHGFLQYEVSNFARNVSLILLFAFLFESLWNTEYKVRQKAWFTPQPLTCSKQ